MVTSSKEDMYKLVQSVNEKAQSKLAGDLLGDAFEAFWPSIELPLKQADKGVAARKGSVETNEKEDIWKLLFDMR